MWLSWWLEPIMLRSWMFVQYCVAIFRAASTPVMNQGRRQVCLPKIVQPGSPFERAGRPETDHADFDR
jgi:hypothetical protein